MGTHGSQSLVMMCKSYPLCAPAREMHRYWQVMTKIIRVCHCVAGMMDSWAQVGLQAGCLACGGIERGSLLGFEGKLKLLLWWPVGTVSSVEV
jgi:hypothetical protein